MNYKLDNKLNKWKMNKNIIKYYDFYYWITYDKSLGIKYDNIVIKMDIAKTDLEKRI